MSYQQEFVLLNKQDQERSLAYRKCMVLNFVRRATDKHINIIKREGQSVLQEMNISSSVSFQLVRDGYAVIELLEKALRCNRNAYESVYCSKIITFFEKLAEREPCMRSIAIKVQEGLVKEHYREPIQPTHEQYREPIQPIHEQYRGHIQPTHEQYREPIQPTHEQYREPIQPTHEQYREHIQPSHEQYREHIQPTHERDALAVPSKEDSAYFSDPSLFYPINHLGVPRGVCLIINQDLNRANSVIDVERCKQTFSRLNYIVKAYNNLDGSELLQALKSTRDSINNGTYVCDSFIAFICSHGDENTLTFGKEKVPREKIVEHFLGPFCPALIRKPKLFFFQNCRGHTGLVSSETADANVGEPEIVVEPDNFDLTDLVSMRHEAKPLLVDVLISYATLESFVAYRLDSFGSLYLHHLFELLDNPTYSKKSYNNVLTRLRELVQEESTRILSDRNHSGIQITEDRNTLTKDFCFNPYLM